MDPKRVLGHVFEQTELEYGERDMALYALAIGASGKYSSNSTVSEEATGEKDGTSSVRLKELTYTAPRIVSSHFCAFPTFAVLFPGPVQDQILGLSGLQFDPVKLLHGEHYLELLTPSLSLPTEAAVVSQTRIGGITDKGKSALLEVETTTWDRETGQPMAFNCATCVLRGAGGFGGSHKAQPTSSRALSLPLSTTPPGTPPDAVLSQPIADTQALVYRLCGDLNPIHADPDVAQHAGFPRPILHGLCSLGFVCRAVQHSVPLLRRTRGAPAPDSSPNPAGSERPLSIRRLRARFLSHVFPGEVLTTKIWSIVPSTLSMGINAPSNFPQEPVQGSGVQQVGVFAFVNRAGRDKAVLSATVELAGHSSSGLAFAARL